MNHDGVGVFVRTCAGCAELFVVVHMSPEMARRLARAIRVDDGVTTDDLDQLMRLAGELESVAEETTT